MNIIKLNEIPFKQTIKYSSFIFCLANLLNDSYTLAYVNKFKYTVLDTYFKNYIYHRMTDQMVRPELIIEPKVIVNIFPGIVDQRIRNSFDFDAMDSSLTTSYKVYFVNTFYTHTIAHEILVIKPMFTSDLIYVVDSYETNVIQIDPNDLFKLYDVIGYSTIDHYKMEDSYFNFDQIKHLIAV